MENLNNELLKLSTFEPETLLKKIADFSVLGEDVDKIPMMSIALSSGQIVNGRLIKYNESTRNATVLVTAENATHTQATFINLMHVVAISLANVTQHAHHFSEGRIAVPVFFEKVTKLGFKKELSELADRIRTSTNLPIEFIVDFDTNHYDIDLNNYTIKKLSETTFGAIKAVAEDPLGIESLIQKVKSIVFTEGENPEVMLENEGMLKIAINPSKGAPGSFETETLQKAIEDQL